MAAKLKLEVASVFKMYGLSLRSEASNFLVNVLGPVSEVQREAYLDRLLEIIQKQPLSSSLVDKETCEIAVQECNTGNEEDGENAFCVIDTFSVPRYTYSVDRKKFILDSNLGVKLPLLHGGPEDKAKLFQDRYTILHQRTLRHNLFTTPVIDALDEEESKKFQLKPVEYLLGTTTKVGEIIVLGMLVQLKEGKWHLEDPTGCVRIDLSSTNFHTGLFTENCFVLAEGSFEDGIFQANALGFPPPEPAKITRAYFGNINFFGGPSATCAKASVKLRHLEEENEDAMFVFLSDVWLDQTKVMKKLKVLFGGYSDYPPVCFVFCGNFLSSPHTSNSIRLLKESFCDLGNMLLEFPSLLQSSRFIFVPGPLDPGPTSILPRPAIPNSITEEFRKKVPYSIFTSNPCRIQYCTQEIVVFREDIVMKICRNCVKFPTDGDIPMHFSKTIIAQGHLCPIPLHVCPVYWAHDCGLQLYPLPDLVVCADKYDAFQVNSVDCIVMNPGSFPRSEFGFKVYMPNTKQVEDSKIR